MTGLAGSRRRAVLGLGALVAGWVVCLRAAARGGFGSIHDHRDLTDHLFYRSVSARVGAGAGYYKVVAANLPIYGFPMGSTFNWRTPLYAHVLGWLGGAAANQMALATLATVAAASASVLVARVLGTAAGLATGWVVAASSAWWAHREPTYFTESWAGLLILAAIGARGLGFVCSAFVAGVLALFIRELALPFVALCLFESWVRHRAREAIAWGACLVLYAVHLAGHIAAVADHQIVPSALPVPGWVACGGVGFVLATARMNYALSLLTDWCAAIYLPVAVFGLVALGRRVEPIRWTLIGMNGYLLAFTVLGRDFNWYWGWVTAPTLALGAAVAPFFLADTFRAITTTPGHNSRGTSYD